MVEVHLTYTLLRRMGIVADDAAKLAQRDALAQEHMSAIATIGKQIGTQLDGAPIVTSAIWSAGSSDDYTATIISVPKPAADAYVDAINSVGANAPLDRQHEYQPILDAFTQ